MPFIEHSNHDIKCETLPSITHLIYPQMLAIWI